MLTLALATLFPLAHAQDRETMDVALEPEGCWGDVLSAVPGQGAVDVPVDIAPRFYINGRCDTGVLIELQDAEGTVVSTQVDVDLLQWGTSFVVHPAADLQPNSDYTLFISPEFGTELALGFTTGEGRTTPPSELTVTRIEMDGWCEGRNDVGYQAMLELQSQDSGFLGYAAGTIGMTQTYQPIIMEDGPIGVWTTVDADRGDAEGCVFIALIGDDGELTEWEPACAELPDVGNCRNGLFNGRGCGRERTPVAVPREGLLLLPFLPLFALRRRRGNPDV